MKFELFVVAVLVCITFDKCVAKWCVKTKDSEILAFKPHQTSPEILKENITMKKQMWVCCEGYTLVGKNCVAECEGGCPDTLECIEPNICGCAEEYHLRNGVCIPDCENCENGRCSEGVCLCNAGFARINDKCEPQCESDCPNGKCVSPQRCVCNEGFRENPETNECESECGVECGLNAFCSSSGECVCKSGFYKNDENVCTSWCTTPCNNGDCVGLNNCACHQGYVKVDGLCIPDCQAGCKFGDCTAEDVCICWPGFLYNPINGNCQEPELTTTTVNTTMIMRTSTASTTSTTTTTSRPKTTTAQEPHFLRKKVEEMCPEYCPNGNCTKGFCQCGEGRVRVDLLCALHCKRCQVGECVENHLCKRIANFEMPVNETASTTTVMTSTSTESATESTTDSISRTCETGCWAGSCVDGVCQCPDGLILNGENDCIRPCEALCKNGICNQENVCVCQDGFVLKNGTECVPVCEKVCENGFCITPNRCECYEGYIHSLAPDQEHICLPTCDGFEGSEGCLNGTCVGINKCQCSEGLIINPSNRFECIPYPVDVATSRPNRSWYIYLLIGILIILLMIILLLLALRKFHQDTYNVEKVEKCRAEAHYRNI